METDWRWIRWIRGDDAGAEPGVSDLRHQREVAIKVMRPELAEALGADRFLREIDFAA